MKLTENNWNSTIHLQPKKILEIIFAPQINDMKEQIDLLRAQLGSLKGKGVDTKQARI